MGINRTDGRCLDIIDREGPVPRGPARGGERPDDGGRHRGIDRLEKAGYARRLSDPNDRRRVLVELTDLARERAGVIWGPFADFHHGLASYSIEELTLLRDFARMGREYNESAPQSCASCASASPKAERGTGGAGGAVARRRSGGAPGCGPAGLSARRQRRRHARSERSATRPRGRAPSRQPRPRSASRTERRRASERQAATSDGS